jgi:hypothetical protein
MSWPIYWNGNGVVERRRKTLPNLVRRLATDCWKLTKLILIVAGIILLLASFFSEKPQYRCDSYSMSGQCIQ